RWTLFHCRARMCPAQSGEDRRVFHSRWAAPSANLCPTDRLRYSSDSDYSELAARSPNEPFHVAWVACENRSFLPKGCRHHGGVIDDGAHAERRTVRDVRS